MAPTLIGRAEEFGGVARGGEERFRGREATGDHEPEFHRVIAFAEVGAVGDLHAGLHRGGKFFFGRRSFASSFGAVPGVSNSG